MWEPFTEEARRLVVQSQAIAQRAGHNYIGTEHLTYALTELESEVGRVMAAAVDRAAIEAGFSATRESSVQEMVFTPGAKRAIEKAFENARRLGDNYMGAKHLALGVLETFDAVPLRPGVDGEGLRASLDAVHESESPTGAEQKSRLQREWELIDGDAELHPVAELLRRSIIAARETMPPGTQVSLSIAAPDGSQRCWSWRRVAGETTSA